MNNLLTKHYQVTETLLKTLKAYIGCKNYGIHGYFIKNIHQALDELTIELNNLVPDKNKKPIPAWADLNFRVLPVESVVTLREKVWGAYCEYAKFPQSCLVKEIKNVLEQLND